MWYLKEILSSISHANMFWLIASVTSMVHDALIDWFDVIDCQFWLVLELDDEIIFCIERLEWRLFGLIISYQYAIWKEFGLDLSR